MKHVLYLSGPITGIPDFNRPAFNEAARTLRMAGHRVFNPIENGIPPEADWATHMRADIAALMACDAVATLPGCAASKGARLELHNARALGMRVMTVAQWLAHAETKTLEAA